MSATEEEFEELSLILTVRLRTAAKNRSVALALMETYTVGREWRFGPGGPEAGLKKKSRVGYTATS